MAFALSATPATPNHADLSEIVRVSAQLEPRINDTLVCGVGFEHRLLQIGRRLGEHTGEPHGEGDVIAPVQTDWWVRPLTRKRGSAVTCGYPAWSGTRNMRVWSLPGRAGSPSRRTRRRRNARTSGPRAYHAGDEGLARRAQGGHRRRRGERDAAEEVVEYSVLSVAAPSRPAGITPTTKAPRGSAP